MKQDFLINNQDELESLFGSPSERVAQKLVSHLDEAMQAFIQRSPLIFISTIDKNGRIDVSPKGDAAGFVQIDQHANLLIPERPGNKLMFGFRNIFNNPNIGLIFVIPKTRETLRVKGKAQISRDPELLEQLSANDKPALLCTYVSVEECFFHCGKAMIRSKLWDSESWLADENLMVRHFVAKDNVDQATMESVLEEAYRDKLY